MFLSMTDKERGSPADFRNTSGDKEKSVTSCGFRVTASPGPQEDSTSEKIPVSSKEAAWIRSALPLAADSESGRRDARFQSGPTPGDFGDHKPIPEEAVTSIPLGQDEKELSLSVQRQFAEAFGLTLTSTDDDFFIELRGGVVHFTKAEVEDVEYFQKKLFKAVGMPANRVPAEKEDTE